MSWEDLVNKIIHPGSMTQEEMDKVKNDTSAAQAHEASIANAQKIQDKKHIEPHTVGETYQKLKNRSQQIKDALGE